MSLNSTPRSDRLHIGFFGRRNAGKSSLINAFSGQDTVIVSDTPGTTADPVFKSMELHPVGPVVLIDTAGFDDTGTLGELRVAKTEEILKQTDVAVLVMDGEALAAEHGLNETGGAEHREMPAEADNRGIGEDCSGSGAWEENRAWIRRLKEARIPLIAAVNKWDLLDESRRTFITGSLAGMLDDRRAADAADTADAADIADTVDATDIADTADAADTASGTVESRRCPMIPVSARTGDGIEALRLAIQDAAPEEFLEERLLKGYLEDVESPLVLLVMPQDIQAPKGRLILPQVQTIRELLDRRCTVVSTTKDTLKQTLGMLSRSPDLIITDSQCFAEVWSVKPEESPLTSFSILMAAAKGDIHVFLEGVAAIDAALQGSSAPAGGIDAVGLEDGAPDSDAAPPFHVLIAEACTHVPMNEDIGSVKIPRLLRNTFGDRLRLTSVRGSDFPDAEELGCYNLIIHCGACMFNRRLVCSRIDAARKARVPITNYGVFLAKMAGILDRISIPE